MDYSPKSEFTNSTLDVCASLAGIREADFSFAAVLARLVRLLFMLLAAALAAVAWGYVEGVALPPVGGLPPRALQVVATAVLVLAISNAGVAALSV